MSVLLETSVGDIVVDLETQLCPKSCQNFLKLCQKHYYKFNAFFSVQKDFLAQTGDPTNTGKGGENIWSLLPVSSSSRSSKPYFKPETHPTLKHGKKGTVSFACIGDDEDDLLAGSQFFITLKDQIDYLNGKHAPFATVVEGQEEGGALDKINQAFVDEQQRPLKDIRIRHIVVLEDPFLDPDGFSPPSRSPSPTPEQIKALRLADTEDIQENRDAAEIEESRRKADSSAAALTLEMVGDLPFAQVRPPENILFVCKLNPITRGEDLELIFSRFGKIMSCQVIKDKKTGDSLQYAFIEFDKKEDAEMAYFKMQNVLVDDRRIWVDFSQSVSKLHGDWLKKRNGGRDPPPGHGGGRGDDDRRREAPSRRGGGGGNMVFDFDDGHSRWREPDSRSYRDDDRRRGGGDRYRSDERRDDRYSRREDERHRPSSHRDRAEDRHKSSSYQDRDDRDRRHRDDHRRNNHSSRRSRSRSSSPRARRR